MERQDEREAAGQPVDDAIEQHQQPRIALDLREVRCGRCRRLTPDRPRRRRAAAQALACALLCAAFRDARLPDHCRTAMRRSQM